MLLIAAVAAVLQASQAGAPTPPPFDCSAAEYRQFDFWVGDWDVVPNPETMPKPVAPASPRADRKPARNVISKIQSGCVIHENWDDGAGGTGESYNIFDRVQRQWHQTWVANNGGLHRYWGELKNGSMVYVGEVPLGPTQRVQGRRTVRVTFTPLGPDRVRQFSESLNTDGTWSINYDLIYTRRAKTK
ncbi:MAG TPA: hypothetical protein VEC39_09940 [Vicinamibacterales bacterium]|nr:hypothetical protein [Vicinamibacterales bacterium]